MLKVARWPSDWSCTERRNRKWFDRATGPGTVGCTCAGALTRVGCARVEQRVGVGDELQLAVEAGQAGAGKAHAHLAVASHRHAVHVRGHVQRPQGGGEVYL